MGVLNPAVNKRKEQAGSKEEKKQGGTFGSLRLLGRFMLGQRGLFFMASLMLIFEAFTAVQVPLLTAFVVNYLTRRLEQLRGIPVLPPASPLELLGLPTIVSPDFDTIAIITAGYIVLTMINSLGDSLAEIYLARGGRRLGYNLRVGLYSHLQKLSLAFHDQRRTGDILTRVTSDVAAIEDFIISSLSDFVGSVLLIVFILYVMLSSAWQVAIVAGVVIPVMAFISNYFTKRIKSASKKLRASEGELASAAQEMLTSIRVIQTYGLGSYEQEMFAAQSQKAMDTALESAGLQARFSWIVSVMGAASTAAVIWMGVWLIFRNPLVADIGLLTAFITYIKDMFKPTKRIIQEWNTLAKLYASLDRIADLFDRKPAVQDLPGAVPAPLLKGHLEFRNVSFAYQPIPSSDGQEPSGPPKMSLKNLSFDIEAGKVIAIVGHTGAGKSTIVQLIPRLYDPLEGQILIDGRDIRELTLDSLRAQISMVLQETILFSGSLVENIAYGRTDATWAQIINAAKQANAHEFIEKMQEGYYSRLGERAANLSGGQRQRIAIARAFIRNTPILILDEPSTGLDAESTELVLKALRTLMEGKTTVIISHDLNLIRHADKIVVIRDGEVEQVGTHASLLEEGGLYANLYKKQYGVAEVKSPAGPELSPTPAVGLTLVEQPQDGEPLLPEPESVYLDLPNSPSMLSRLPALNTAFDGDRMREILQPILFGNGDAPYAIESCRPGKALYLPENIVNMQFDLRVSGIGDGQNCTFLVNARLFPTLEECELYRAETLAPLSAQMRSRPEMAPFQEPVSVLEGLNMAISVFPIDGMLPTLIGATDCERMIKVFNNSLPEALSDNLKIEDMRFEVVHYGRYQRCVLRYVLQGRGEDGSTPQERVVFGKVDSDGYSALTIPVMGALMEHMGRRLFTYNFRIPRPIGFVQDLNLLLMEALPGNVRLKDLLLDRLCGAGLELPGDLTLEEALESCARMLVVLHTSKIELGRRRNFEDEISMVSAEVEAMELVFPSLGGQLHSWLDEVIAFGRSSIPMSPVFSHGDFTYSQLIFQGKESGLVDFDSICQAEPGLDLGQFLAYQRLVICKEQHPEAPMDSVEVERLSDLFLSTYIAHSDWLADETLLRNRTMAYEVISLIRLAVHSWDKLKGTRLNHTLNILKGRISCLSRVS
ncbi:MAG TPA: ABC transporter transmembrane domain-containing protein [Anaerolineales bacterium]|nr:ABC transporter transmembrane domain-containing protein [Anaerolineales bacterium]